MIELPHLAWFSQFELLDPLFEKTISIFDLLRVRSGASGLLGYNLLFIFNTLAFKMTTLFDVYLNDIMVLVIGIISVCKTRQIASKKDYSYLLSLAMICITAFSAIQLSSGTMETQVRLGILFFVIATLYIDKVLLGTYNKKDLILSIILIFISINLFGTAYSFAGIPVIFLICLIKFIKNRKIDLARLYVLISYIFAMLLYFIQYFYLVKGPWRLKDRTLLVCIVDIITHPIDVCRAIFGYNASGLIGSAGYLDGRVSENFYACLGAIITAIMIYAVVRFIQLKMYKKTFIPIMFMGYSFFVPFLVMLDREISLKWLINEWYVVNTKLGIIGTIMILMYVYQNSKNKVFHKVVVGTASIIILLSSLYGNVVHVSRAKNVRAYYEAKQPYLFAQNINELPVDANGLTPLIATPEDTMKAINLMKKYRLSVYRYYGAYDKYLRFTGKYEAGSTIDTINILSGIYQDFWTEKTCEFELKTKETGKIKFKFYSNTKLTGNETGRIYIDNEFVRDYKLVDKMTEINITTKPNSLIKVKFENDFEKNIDDRKLSFILADIQCE